MHTKILIFVFLNQNIWATICENQPKWRSCQNLVNYSHLIYEVLRSYPANFMKLSPLFMKIWSFETKHCLKFNTQSQKHYDITDEVKVNFLICGFAGSMKNMLCLANILFFIILNMCVMEFAEKLTLFHFCPKFVWSENGWPYFKNSDSCSGKVVSMETYGMITMKYTQK